MKAFQYDLISAGLIALVLVIYAVDTWNERRKSLRDFFQEYKDGTKEQYDTFLKKRQEKLESDAFDQMKWKRKK